MSLVLFRFSFAGFALLACVFNATVATAQTEMASEAILPPNTKAWVSVADAEALKTAIEGTQFGAMMNDPNVKPFVDDLANQVRAYLDEQNIRFGMKVSDIEEIQSGEICLAGVLKEQAAAAGTGDSITDHAVVLLVDVAKSKDKAVAMLERVKVELTSREATETKMEVNGVAASKWSFKKPQGLRQKQFAFHAIVGKWLVACDNESTFRDIIGRIGKTKEGIPTLAESPAFTKVVDQCQFDEQGYKSHVRWFIEPFGYVQLAQAISDAQTSGKGLRNNYAEKFHEEGFSAIKGLGGVVSVATGEHEAVHRTIIYAPPVPDAGEDRYHRAAAMLDFSNTDGSMLNPPVWVPEDSAGYLTFTWNLNKALEKVGYIIDKTSGTDGSFDRARDSLATDPQGPMVAMREFIALLNNRVTVCSITNLPITDESERIVFGIKIIRDEEYIADAIYRLFRDEANTPIDYNGTRILVVDTADTGDGLEVEIDDFGDEFGDPLSSEEEEDNDEIKRAKPLFEKRVFVVKNGYLMIGNHLDQMKSVVDNMSRSPGNELTGADDYVRVRDAIAELAGDEAPSFRHFGRLDQTLRTNYEMMRTNRMAESKTILAQLLNRAYDSEDQPEGAVREQQIDASKMPEDYDGQVAKYFGPTGLVVHTVPDGWVITGCILKKETTDASTKTETGGELVSENK